MNPDRAVRRRDATRMVLTVLVAAPLLWAVSSDLRRDTARGHALSCEALWLAIQGPAADELDRVLAGHGTSCDPDAPAGNIQAVICLLRTHETERNPRNRAQFAYTQSGDVATNRSSCRVGLVTMGTNAIRFNQFLRPDSTTSRTFTIAVE